MDFSQRLSTSLDIVFIQDTQKTLNDHLSVSLKAIESVIAHAPLLPRYRPGGIRFGLVTFCDDGREPTQDKPEITTYKLSDNHDQFLRSLHSLKAKQVAPVSDGANHALRLALEASAGADWNASSDKIIILSVYKRSRPLDSSIVKILRRLSKENVHLFMTRDMHILDLFDEEPDQAFVKDIERLDFAAPLYISAFIYAALGAHSDRYQKNNEHTKNTKSLAAFFLWDWGCEGEKCSILDTRKPEPFLLGTKRLSLENDRMTGSIPFSEPGSEIQKGRVFPGSEISRFPSLEYGIEKSPTATLVNPMSPGFSSTTRTVSREDSNSEDGERTLAVAFIQIHADTMLTIPSVEPTSCSTVFRASDLEQDINERPVNQVGLNSPVDKGSSVLEEGSDRTASAHQAQVNELVINKLIDAEKRDGEAVDHKGAAHQLTSSSIPSGYGDNTTTDPELSIKATASEATIVTQSKIEALLKYNTQNGNVFQNPSILARENEAPNDLEGAIPDHFPTQDSDDVGGFHNPTSTTPRKRIQSHPANNSSDELGGNMPTEATPCSPSTFVSPQLTELPASEQNRETKKISRDVSRYPKRKKTITDTERAAEPSSDSAGAEKKHDHMIDSVLVGPLASQSQRPVSISHTNRDTEKPGLIALKSETISRDAVPGHDDSVPSRAQSAQQVPDSSKTPSVSQTRHSEQTLINSINAKKQPISSGQRLAYADVLKSAKSADILRKPVGQTDDRGRYSDGSARELDSDRRTKFPLSSSPAHPPSIDTHDKQDSKLHQRNEEVVTLTDKANANDVPILSNVQSESSSSRSARNEKDLTHNPIATPTANSVKSPDLRSDEMSGEMNSVPLIRSDRKRQDIEEDVISPTKKEKDSASSVGPAVTYSPAAEGGLQVNVASDCAVGLDQNSKDLNVFMKAGEPGPGVGTRARQSEEQGKDSGTSDSSSEGSASEKANTVIVQKGGSSTPRRGKDISSENRLLQPTGCRRPVSKGLPGIVYKHDGIVLTSYHRKDSLPSKSLGSPNPSKDSANLSSSLMSQKMHEAENTTGEKPVAQESESNKSIENRTLKETRLGTTVNSSQVKSSSASNRRSDTLSEASLKSDFKTSVRSEQHVKSAETHVRPSTPRINDTDGETTAIQKAANRTTEESHAQAVLRMAPQITKHQHTDQTADVPTAGSEFKSQQNLMTSNSGGNIIRYDTSSSPSLVPARDYHTISEGQRPTQGAEEKVSSCYAGSTTTTALKGLEIATRELHEKDTPSESNRPSDCITLPVNQTELRPQRGQSDVTSEITQGHASKSTERKAPAAEEGESISSGSSRLASQKNDANMEGIHPLNAIVPRPRKEMLQSAHLERQCENGAPTEVESLNTQATGTVPEPGTNVTAIPKARPAVPATEVRSRTGHLGSKLPSPDGPAQKPLEKRRSSSKIGPGASSGRIRGQLSPSLYPNEDTPFSINNRSPASIPKPRDSQHQVPSQSSASTPKQAGTENKMTSSNMVKEPKNAHTLRENSCYSIEPDCNSTRYQVSLSIGESRLVNNGVEGAANDTLTNIDRSAAPAILLATSQLAVPSSEHQTSQGVNAPAVQQPMDTASSPQVMKREEATGVPTTCPRLESPRSPAIPFRKKDSTICNDGNTNRLSSSASAPKGRAISDTEPTSRPTEEKGFPSNVGNNLANSSVKAPTSIKVDSNESGESVAFSPSRPSARKALIEENQPSRRSSDLGIQGSAASKGCKEIGNKNDVQLPHPKKDILQFTHRIKRDEGNLSIKNVSLERTVPSSAASDVTVPKLRAVPHVAETKVAAQQREPRLPGLESHRPNHLGISPSILEKVHGNSGNEAEGLSSPSSLADEGAGIPVISRSPTSNLEPQYAQHLAPNWPSAPMPKQFDDKVSTPRSTAIREAQIDGTETKILKASTKLADTISASPAYVPSRLEDNGAKTTTRSARQVTAHQDTDRATNIPSACFEPMSFQGPAISLGGGDSTARNDTYASSSPQKDSAVSGDQPLTQVDNGEKAPQKTVVGLTDIVKQSSGDEAFPGPNSPSSQILSRPRHHPSITAPPKSEKDSMTDPMRGKGRFEVATREAYSPKSRSLPTSTSEEAGVNKECSQVLSATAAESMLTWKGALNSSQPEKQRESSASTIGVSSNTQVTHDSPGPGGSRVAAAKLDSLVPATESKVSPQQRGSKLASPNGPPSSRLGIPPQDSNVINGALGSEARDLPSPSSRPNKGTGIPVNGRSPTSNLMHQGSQQLMPNRPSVSIPKQSAISTDLGVSDPALIPVGREAVTTMESAHGRTSELQQESTMNTARGKEHAAEPTPDDSSAIQEGSVILQSRTGNKGASQLTEDMKGKGKQAQMMVNEEMRKPVQVSKEPRVPFVPKIEVGEQPITKEQTRRVVLEALMTFTRFSAM
ncbi:hypothetical protein ACEPAI_4333 [Sanghuangporus weigelae]